MLRHRPRSIASLYRKAPGGFILATIHGGRKRGGSADTKRRTTRASPERSIDRIKRLTLDLPEALHRTIKREAVEQGLTMAQMLRTLLLKHYDLSEERP